MPVGVATLTEGRTSARLAEVGPAASISGLGDLRAGTASLFTVGAVVGGSVQSVPVGDSSKNPLDPGGIVFAADDIVRGVSSLPEHDTTKLGISKEATNELVRFCWVQIVFGAARGVRVGGQADIDLCVRIVKVDLRPLLERDVISTFAIGIVDASTSRAVLGVVELDEQKVEPEFGDQRCEMIVWYNTLGRSRDVIALGSVFFEESLFEGRNHLSITASLVVANGLALVYGCGGELALDIKVESIHNSIAERTWLLCIGPGVGLGTKGAPQELSE